LKYFSFDNNKKRQGIFSGLFLFRAWRIDFIQFSFSPSLLIFALLLWASCDKPEENNNTKNYFDLQQFIAAETKTLSTNSYALKKKNELNGVIDSIGSTAVNWEKELSIFADADINKPAWKKSFSIDSLITDSSLSLFYQALDSNIAIRHLQVNLLHGQVNQITFKKAKSNFVYNSSQTCSFTRNIGFAINGKQKILWFTEKTYAVSGYFNLESNHSPKF